jgi:hypothetical protein
MMKMVGLLKSHAIENFEELNAMLNLWKKVGKLRPGYDGGCGR